MGLVCPSATRALQSMTDLCVRLSTLSDSAPKDTSDLLMKVSSILQAKPQSKSRMEVPLRSEQFSVIKLPAKNTSLPAFELLAVCDPVSEAAQKVGPIVQVLHQVLNANVRIALNAIEKHSEMPLKRYVGSLCINVRSSTFEITMSNSRISRSLAELSLSKTIFPNNWDEERRKKRESAPNVVVEYPHCVGGARPPPLPPWCSTET